MMLLDLIKRNLKLPFYTATKGLERFLANERFIVYRYTHKRLLKEDAVYRKRRNAYVFTIACLAIVIIACNAIALVIGFNANGSGKIVLEVFSLICVVPMIIFFAFRHQAFMNERIGAALQKDL